MAAVGCVRLFSPVSTQISLRPILRCRRAALLLNLDHRPTELCLATIDEIKRQARENGFNSFHFSLSGGEPTFHPGYLDILQHLADDVGNTNYTSIHMTSNCSRNMKWFEDYVQRAKPFHRASITASLHTEHLDTKEKMQDFADKLILCQEHDVQVTINMVMVPDWFERDWENALFFHEQGINVTLKPQSDPTASRVVEGYTEEQMKRLWNGMPQLAYTETKRQWEGRPKPNFQVPDYSIGQNDKSVPWHMQVEFTDSKGKKWYMDQAERFNAFNFNNFEGWDCNSGYQGIIIREPDGSIKSKNLSKIKLNLIGSTSVIDIHQATNDPAPEPLPGPTGISFSLAHFI